MAAKSNGSAAQIDLPAYEWSKSCSPCHPGGGPMEKDRDGRRYDVRAAAKDWAPFDGDYHGSDWAASGVLEADCLLCHQSSYATARRGPLLAKAWHRAAPTEGAGMGVARDNATIDYDVGFRLQFGAVGDRNCNQCHAAHFVGGALDLFNSPGNLKSDVAKRGRSSADPSNPDVHEGKLACVDCHGAGEGQVGGVAVTKLEHQFRKGHVMIGSSVRDELDGALGQMDCADCHTQGTHGAPAVPATALHTGHASAIACSTCHIPRKGLFAARAFDFAEGQKVPFWIGGNPKAPYGGGFDPVLLWWKDAPDSTTWKIRPFNALTAVFWNKGASARDAFFLKDVAAVYGALPPGTLTNDVPDASNLPEPNTQAEIEAMSAAIAAAKPGTDPVLWIEPDWFQLSHNVAPKEQAIGAGGCTDCHRTGSPFFNRDVTLLPFAVADVAGKVVMEVTTRRKDGTKQTIHGVNRTLPMWRLLGYTQERKEALERLLGN